MDALGITPTGTEFHIDGFPDAIKVLKIRGAKSKHLADLALHRGDLEFTLECLEAINQTPEEPYLLREVLWQAAVVHYTKCFGHSASRFSLDRNVIYKGETGAVAAYQFIISYRNKHLIHDENSYTQSLAGAVLNKKDMPYKIAKIICLTVTGNGLVQGNYANLHLLATRARDWVIAQYNERCNVLTAELEAKPYDELAALEGITYSVPTADEVHKTRAAL
jgi:hypothetical protein